MFTMLQEGTILDLLFHSQLDICFADNSHPDVTSRALVQFLNRIYCISGSTSNDFVGEIVSWVKSFELVVCEILRGQIRG